MLQHFLKVPPEAMQLANTEARYGALSRALHWATAICVVVVWLLAQFMGDFPKGVVRDSAFATHIALGELVIVVLAVRLLWRFANPPPALPTLGRLRVTRAHTTEQSVAARLLGDH
jgi:cytochrome b561